MTNSNTNPSFSPGLEDVPVCKSKVCFIDGDQGILEYRGYRVEDLAEHSNFEETAYLLLKGVLPSQSAVDAFKNQIRNYLELNPKVIKIIQTLPPTGHPMSAIQAGVAALGMFYPFPVHPSPQDLWDHAVRIISKLPIIIGVFHRHKQGLKPITPDLSQTIAWNLIYGITGKKPNEEETRVMDACLVLHAEHSLNASTFAARAIGSSLADPYAVASGAVGSLSGRLHGGANEAVMKMLRSIGSVENVKNFVDEKIAKKEKIMGMGHRVYKTKDPRAVVLQKIANNMFKNHQGKGMLAIAEALENVCFEKFSKKGIWPNVDFFSGLVYNKLGIPEDFFTTIFAASRAPGWLAHWIEQMADNRIFRPEQIYEGERNKKYQDILGR